MPSLRSRSAVVTVAAGGVLWLLAAPALAHVEVSAKPARAGAASVVSFAAEGESTTSGITGVRIQLPAGVAAGDVRLVQAPAGWRLTAGQGLVSIGGPALRPSQDAAYSVRVARLPTAASVVFKTVVTYADGRRDSWIELPTGGEEPDNPAPVLKLAPAAPAATTPAPATTAPATTIPATTTPAPATTAAPTTAVPSPATSPAAARDDGGGRGGLVAGIVVVVLAAGATLAYLARRGRARG